MRRPFERVEDLYIRFDDWVNRNCPAVSRVILVLGLTLLVLLAVATALPALLILAFLAGIVAAVVLFAMAWLREFSFLMHLADDAFPGRNDKAIWAVLLIVLPPVGLFLFRAHRRAYWPESEPKPAATANDLS